MNTPEVITLIVAVAFVIIAALPRRRK